MKEPKVSVVIPNFNRVGLLSSAIESVLNQTYTNLEIIIIDDFSTDGSQKLIKQLEKKYKNVFGIFSFKNRGANYCRDLGVIKSTGEIISFLDSDDKFHPTKIEQQVRVLTDFGNEEIGFINCNFYGRKDKKNSESDKIIRLPDLLEKNILGGFSTLMLRKNIYFEVGGLDKNLKSCQDWDIYLKILEKYPGYFMSEPLVDYLIQEDSISKNYENVIQGHENIFRKIRKINQENLYLPSNLLEANQKRMLGSLYRSFNDYKNARKYYKLSLHKKFRIQTLFDFFSTLFKNRVYIWLKTRKG